MDASLPTRPDADVRRADKYNPEQNGALKDEGLFCRTSIRLPGFTAFLIARLALFPTVYSVRLAYPTAIAAEVGKQDNTQA